MTKFPVPVDMDLWEKYTKNLPQNTSRRRYAKLAPKRYPSILDLHGFTLDEGYGVLKTFFECNYAQNSKMVLIITGNNIHGQSFKNKVPRWLGEKVFSQYIASIKPAAPAQGGDGALVVYLKNNKS